MGVSRRRADDAGVIRKEEQGRVAPRLRMLMLTQGAWDHASSRERAARYRALLESTGRWSVHWLPRVPERPRTTISKLRFAIAKRLLTLCRAFQIAFGQWDLVFVQRLFLSPRLLRLLQRRGIPLVYDFDDAIYLDVPGSRANEKRTAAMVKAADQVIVSTRDLLPFCAAQGKSPQVITTPVDTDWITPSDQHEDEVCTVGWIGSASTTPYLNLVAPALADAASRCRIRLLAVGADEAELNLPGVPVEIVPWSFEREPELLRRMTIGIMPLPDDAWARGKGGYKLLLYMAAGLPVVASPVGINREIVRHGETGYLADGAKQWAECLHSLCTRQGLRRSMGQAGRSLAEERYSREVCFERLSGCLDAAIKSRQ